MTKLIFLSTFKLIFIGITAFTCLNANAKRRSLPGIRPQATTTIQAQATADFSFSNIKRDDSDKVPVAARFLSPQGSKDPKGFNIVDELARYQKSETMANLVQCEQKNVSYNPSVGKCWKIVKDCLQYAKIIKEPPGNVAAMSSVFTLWDKGINLLGLLPPNISESERTQAIEFFMKNFRGLVGVYGSAQGANHSCKDGDGTLRNGCGDVSVTCAGFDRDGNKKVGFCSDHYSDKYYNQDQRKDGGNMLALYMPAFDKESLENFKKIASQQMPQIKNAFAKERLENTTSGPGTRGRRTNKSGRSRARAISKASSSLNVDDIIEVSEASGEFSIKNFGFSFSAAAQ